MNYYVARAFIDNYVFSVVDTSEFNVRYAIMKPIKERTNNEDVKDEDIEIYKYDLGEVLVDDVF